MRARIATTWCFIGLCFPQVGCKSEKEKAFERLAATTNPLLEAIKPTALELFEIKANDPSATAKIIKTCTSVDELLWRLRNIKFDDDALSPDNQYPRVSTYAEELLDTRGSFCRPDDGDSTRTQRCRKWCLETWEHLVSSVGDLQAAASREGVEIVLLSSTTKKQAYAHVALEVNPILTALKPTAALMLVDLPAMADTPASTEKIIATCGADPALRRLQGVKFDIQNRSIAEYAHGLLATPERACRTSSDIDMSPEQCREYCVSVWRYLDQEVNKLRAAAGKEGVEVVQMFP